MWPSESQCLRQVCLGLGFPLRLEAVRVTWDHRALSCGILPHDIPSLASETTSPAHAILPGQSMRSLAVEPPRTWCPGPMPPEPCAVLPGNRVLALLRWEVQQGLEGGGHCAHCDLAGDLVLWSRLSFKKNPLCRSPSTCYITR